MDGQWITLSKLLPQLIYPFNVVLWLLLGAFLFVVVGRRKASIVTMVLAITILLVASSPLSIILYRQHEKIYPPVPIAESPSAGAIVVLGGDVGIPLVPRLESQLDGNRLLHAYRLFRAGKAPLIMVTGGNVFPQENVRSEAEYAADILQSWGVAKDAILVEGASRNTRENAVHTWKILQHNGIDKILLVTSAFHMPRALLTFRATGMNVLASPSGYSIVVYKRPALLDWWPKLGNLGKAQAFMHEKLGLMVYGIRGWLDDI